MEKKWHVLIRFDFVGDVHIYRYKTKLAESFKQNFIEHHSKSRDYHIENVKVTVIKPK